MSFVQPTFLFGLLLGAVPILIHLINRRRARTIQFSALHFLLRRDPKLARRLKLKEWLLLVLRTLLVLAIPIALARPYLSQSSGVTTHSGAPRSVVVVIEHSVDQWMLDDKKEAQTPLFNRTKTQANQSLRDLPPGSTAGLILADKTPGPVSPHLGSDISALTRTLNKLEPTFEGSDLATGVLAARDLLLEEGLEHREIHVVGRLSELQLEQIKEIDLKGIGLTLKPVRREKIARNIGVNRVVETKNKTGEPELTAEVQNYSPTEQSVTVRFQLGDQEVRREIKIPGDGTFLVPFTMPKAKASTEQGNLVQISVSEDDFAPDNTFYTKRGAGRELSALIVNGAPRPSRFQDEIFFLTRALESLIEDGLEIRIETITADLLDETTPLSHDVFILANVHLLKREVVQKMDAHIQSGSGLLISCGDTSDAKFGSRFRDLLVLPFREVHETGSQLGADEGLTISSVQSRWQGSQDLAGAASVSLKSARIFRHVVLNPQQPDGPEIRTWLQLENGAPLLLERDHGAGHVMLLTTSLDLDWTDLPAHPGYVQLLNSVIPHLAGQLGSSSSESLEVGTSWVLNLGEASSVREARVVPPEKDHPPRVELLAEGRQRKVVVRNIRKPGFYAVWLRTDGGRETTQMFTANSQKAQMTAVLATTEQIDGAQRQPVKNEQARQHSISPTSNDVPGTPVWPFVLLALMILISMEALTALRV